MSHINTFLDLKLTVYIIQIYNRITAPTISTFTYIFFCILVFLFEAFVFLPKSSKITFSYRSKSEQSHISLSSFSATFFIYSPFHTKTSSFPCWHMYFGLIADMYNMQNLVRYRNLFYLLSYTPKDTLAVSHCLNSVSLQQRA